MKGRVDRNKVNVQNVEQKAAMEKREREFGTSRVNAMSKNDYIKNLINGRYYLARCNMIADQILKEVVEEKIDGAPKSLELLKCEYALMKMQAINSMRAAHFAKIDLQKIGMKPEDIDALEDDYYNGKIIRESYDEDYGARNKAQFVNE